MLGEPSIAFPALVFILKMYFDKVVPYTEFNSDEARAKRQIRQHLKKGNLEIPSTGPGMASVVRKMIESKLYIVELILDKPGYFRVIPRSSVPKGPPKRPHWNYGPCIWFTCGLIISFILFLLILMGAALGMMDIAKDLNRCDQVSCYLCFIFKDQTRFNDICNKCCSF